MSTNLTAWYKPSPKVPQGRRSRFEPEEYKPESRRNLRRQEALVANTSRREAQRAAYETNTNNSGQAFYGAHVTVLSEEDVVQAEKGQGQTVTVSMPIVIHGTVQQLNSANRSASPECVGLKEDGTGKVWILPVSAVLEALITRA